MGLLFGVSDEEREHAIHTVHSLRISTVAGVAAALSWSHRRADRILREVARADPEHVTYDPGNGQVRWVEPTPPPVKQPDPDRPPMPHSPPTTTTTIDTSGSTPRWSQQPRCPACHVPLTPSGTAGLSVCAQCGRLTHVAGAARLAPESKPALPSAVISTAAPSAAVSDRRSQELLAAWVTAQPIPCPKCRTPLRHRGVSEYSCPSCGQRVSFPKALLESPGAPKGPTGPPTGPMPAQ
jgi:uncharacterized Zn finger protein (UPF0148 family)